MKNSWTRSEKSSVGRRWDWKERASEKLFNIELKDDIEIRTARRMIRF